MAVPGGDGDDVATTVLGVGPPSDEPARQEVVQRCHDVAPVDPGAPPELGLAGRTVFIEGGEDSEVVAADAFGREGVPEQVLGPGVGSAQQPGRAVGDPRQR